MMFETLGRVHTIESTYLEEVCVVDRGCPLARALHMVCFPLFFPSLQYSDRKPHHQKHVNSVNYRLHQK